MHHFIILQKYLIITSHVKYVRHYTCKSTIFMVQTLLIKPWPKVPHTMNLFVEDGLKNLVSVNLDGLVHGQYYYRNKNTGMDIQREILFPGYRYIQSVPFLWGIPLHYIDLFLLSEPYTCLGHDFFSDRILLGQAHSSTSLLFWARPHNSPSKLRFLISFRGVIPPRTLRSLDQKLAPVIAVLPPSI